MMESPELSRLIDLAEQMGTAAWPLLVRGEYIEGIQAAIAGSVALVVSISCGVVSLICKKSDFYEELSPPFFVASLFLLVLAVIGVLLSIPQLACPECQAVRSLLP